MKPEVREVTQLDRVEGPDVVAIMALIRKSLEPVS
jgi:hypothetical protein